MKRLGLVVLALTLACLLALPAYSVSTAVGSCTAVAQRLLDNADPRDRHPPQNIVAAIDKWIGLSNVASFDAITLLDRYGCEDKTSGGDWLVNTPLLSWWLERKFDRGALIAVFASTADMQNGAIGFSAGALRYFHKPVDQLDDYGISCLLMKATGKAPPDWHPDTSDRFGYTPPVHCPSDFRMPGRA